LRDEILGDLRVLGTIRLLVASNDLWQDPLTLFAVLVQFAKVAVAKKMRVAITP